MLLIPQRVLPRAWCPALLFVLSGLAAPAQHPQPAPAEVPDQAGTLGVGRSLYLEHDDLR